MCNYPGDDFKHMTTDEWKRKKMSDVPQSTTHAATDIWEELPSDTFIDAGTGVRAVLLMLDA
jgi:hypothetical protein